MRRLGLERDLVDPVAFEHTVGHLRAAGVLLPTFSQLADPSTIPPVVRDRLADVDPDAPDPLNLFRAHWFNGPDRRTPAEVPAHVVLPLALTGVAAPIVVLLGDRFPMIRAHKVLAAYGCLVPRLVTGQFDPTAQKAVWPSTGNYCRGGTFDCALLGCHSVAILPEGMSAERFEWLRSLGAEVIATPGSESNVKEIYDKCWEIRRTRPDCVVFNQFEEMGNAVWHYHTTGGAVADIFQQVARPGDRLAAFVSATGSAGTLAAGDFLRTVHPQLRIVAVEALQCPTLLECGFGEHRIEGIGDKHVPWIHNVRNTDVVCAVDDAQCLGLMRLFNEPEGACFMAGEKVEVGLLSQLPLLGISGICNLVAAIKTARMFDLGGRDVVFTVLTDSMELYRSRLQEERQRHGAYSGPAAGRAFGRWLEAITTDHMRELTYADRRTLHNFKYFTWVEQQGRSADELRRLWEPEYWTEAYAQVGEWDRRIEEFNARTGLL